MILSKNAATYSLSELLRRVSNSDKDTNGEYTFCGIKIYYGDIEKIERTKSPSIKICQCRESAWDDIFADKNPLKWVPLRNTLPQKPQTSLPEQIPVLFWGEGYEDGFKPFAELHQDGSVVFYADIIATTFFMLSRWEEIVVPERDQHDRFPATASLAYKQGFLDRPIVDEYALILREWIKVLLPSWEPEKRLFTIKLSHDIDDIRRLPNVKSTLRALGGDLLYRRSLKLASRTVVGGLAPDNDPFYRGIFALADISLKSGITNDAFYFMAANPSAMESGYPLDSVPIQNCVNYLRQKGFEIGIHPSYNTLDDFALLQKEKNKMDRFLGYSSYGGRQHFLRFRVPDTWRYWEAVGLEYDSTLGYADHEGFRCGTCYQFHPFDVVQDRVLDIEELPLVVMDGTLLDYRRLSPTQGYERIIHLASRCRSVDGTFTLLWHNSSLYGNYYPWINIYQKIAEELSQMQKSI